MAKLSHLALIFLAAIAVGCGGSTPVPAKPVVVQEPIPDPINPDKEKAKAVDLQAQKEAREFEEAIIAPYVKKAQETYPDAKMAFLKGFKPGYTFVVLAKLKDESGSTERVFVTVNEITDGRITGSIQSPVLVVKSFKQGGEHSLPEAEVLDWIILKPNGSADQGNVVGKFLDDWEKTRPRK